eukprot:5266968-Alexandrium_andersonii.AAC.1
MREGFNVLEVKQAEITAKFTEQANMWSANFESFKNDVRRDMLNQGAEIRTALDCATKANEAVVLVMTKVRDLEAK